VVDAGVDGIVLSNHGGRQLDKAPVPLERCPRWPRRSATVRGLPGHRSDLGLRHRRRGGTRRRRRTRRPGLPLRPDGRPVQRGVERAAEILTTQLRRTMALLG